MENTLLREIINAHDNGAGAIEHDTVARWFLANDISTLGALHSFLSERTFFLRVHPAITVPEYVDFSLHYYKRCLLENPQEDWSDSRYEAGWSLGALFRSLWKDDAVPREEIKKIKQWMADLYVSGGEDVRICLVNATLEHLFEDPSIARYFESWKSESPALKEAYEAASVWAHSQN